jgi:hypothetical protein
VEVKGLHRWTVAAVWQKLETAWPEGRRAGWKAVSTTPGRAATSDGLGSASGMRRRNAGEPVMKLRNRDTSSNLRDMGWGAVRDRPARGGQLRSRFLPAGGEATLKVCDVVVAILPEYSWAPHSSSDSVVNVGTARGRPFLRASSLGKRAGPSPTGGGWAGRRPRSSPGGGKLRTWRRGPASQQEDAGMPGARW